MRKVQIPRRRYPSEHDEQRSLFVWKRIMTRKYPELAAMYAVPNGGHRHVLVAKKLQAEGVQSGVPDVHLPVRRGPFTGLWIELKSLDPKARMTPNQEEWFALLTELGHRCVCCHGWVKASREIENYLNLL